MNSVNLIGRLARDPELTYKGEGENALAICRFTIAVDRPRKKGEDSEADFIRIIVFGRQGENADKYLSKGRQAGVSGRIQTGSYKKQDGTVVYTTDVIADRVEFLGGGEGGGTGSASPKKEEAKSEPEFNGFDDLPDSFEQADDEPF